MFWFIKQIIVALLSLSGSLTTKYVSLNNEPYMTRPMVVNLNPVQLNYYLFMISLDKRNGSCNLVDDSSAKISVSNKTRDANDKVFNMITRINEVKALVKHNA